MLCWTSRSLARGSRKSKRKPQTNPALSFYSLIKQPSAVQYDSMDLAVIPMPTFSSLFNAVFLQPKTHSATQVQSLEKIYRKLKVGRFFISPTCVSIRITLYSHSLITLYTIAFDVYFRSCQNPYLSSSPNPYNSSSPTPTSLKIKPVVPRMRRLASKSFSIAAVHSSQP
jgi:hypothetical protein